jgi:hypothetical protein
MTDAREVLRHRAIQAPAGVVDSEDPIQLLHVP